MIQTSVLSVTAVMISDSCEDDIAVADAAVDEESQAEEDSQSHSLGDTDYNSDFIWEDMDNYNG
jgi:hypothetical protein